ncbi:MAG: fatty acid desaturase [Verrucomicrobiales bacterium]|nr:fatty acid desaturase [Verrucomicrobiales bacterium]
MNLDADPATRASDRKAEIAAFKRIVATYEKPNAKRASWQLFNSLGSYVALWVGMYFALKVSWWLVIPLALLAAGIIVRVFIIFHDCGHGSFFKSERANNFWGFICGMFTMVSYGHWRWEHSRHHATSGDLDRRGIGDIWTLTVQEYLESSRWKKFAYRLARNPFILFVIAPLFLFFVRERFPIPEAKKKERRAVYTMNAVLLLNAIVLSLIFGFVPYLIIQLIITGVSGAAGIWLFYVQHQFEGVYWERRENWSYMKAALEGSSFYKLPKVLQWFSGNIGFHHIHHLSPKIPNYNLEECHHSDPMFHEIEPLTFLNSLKSLKFRLWDERNRNLVGYSYLRKVRAKQNSEQAAA